MSARSLTSIGCIVIAAALAYVVVAFAVGIFGGIAVAVGSHITAAFGG